ncbi:MAG: sugar phosphate isomerase/epimerase [Planctomycetes bacterium]|nr:sugar phosphate isomerase/epimerase [Planctomycetota bacterium]
MLRIRYGAHCYMWTDRWTDDDIRILESARRLGLECIEVSIGDDVVFDTALLKKEAAALDIALTVGPGGLWPCECDISDSDPANRRLGLEWHRKSLKTAGDMGAVAYCGAIYRHPGKVSCGPFDADGLSWARDNLAILADYAAGLGVALVIEPMSHFRTDLVNTPQQAAGLTEAVGHPNLKVLVDTYHIVTEVRDYRAAICGVGRHLWGLHACESDRGVPGGGLVPWKQVFDALREIGGDFHVLMESYNSAGGFARSRGIFNDVCPDAEAFVVDGLRFLRGME